MSLDQHYITICPDIGYYLQFEDGSCDGYYDDRISNEESDHMPRFSFIIPGLSEWQTRFTNVTDFATNTSDPDFDWKSWHRDGLQLAKEIQRLLPRNYSVIYKKPFEDNSNIIDEVDLSKENVDEIIESLGADSYSPGLKPSYQDDVEFIYERIGNNQLSITFRIRLYEFTFNIRTINDFKWLRIWMENVVGVSDEIVTQSFDSSEYHFLMIPQYIGQFTDMGQFRIEDKYGQEGFCAYVNRRDFIKKFYLSLMCILGFRIYPDNHYRSNKQPDDEKLKQIWQPYNMLRSDIIEWYITDDLYNNHPMTKNKERLVNETVSMWVDCGCCFWDTMGIGSGDESGLILDSGTFKMDIPGLKEWIGEHENMELGPVAASWLKKGWNLAKEIRKRLPENVDLYYQNYERKGNGAPEFLIVPFQDR